MQYVRDIIVKIEVCFYYSLCLLIVPSINPINLANLLSNDFISKRNVRKSSGYVIKCKKIRAKVLFAVNVYYSLLKEAIDSQGQEEVKDATSGEEAKKVTKVSKENKTKQVKSRGNWYSLEVNGCGNFRLEDSSKKKQELDFE
ncbi:hypothetical protein RirG_228630 [Rhizophagus irregularis DAOM 197198w]|uniref:Uncharacterized protein n=1 Tax=Rhizophagus irregularis (strain DAOM 197198w) TaxID=1432141 RepID=A0A015K6L9_RHIIW|nr:hypothetical protein RirG_228630 [Rhizophagus irregularis DAOM 197198w]